MFITTHKMMANLEMMARQCPICNLEFDPAEEVCHCPGCGGYHHLKCWELVGQCPPSEPVLGLELPLPPAPEGSVRSVSVIREEARGTPDALFAPSQQIRVAPIFESRRSGKAIASFVFGILGIPLMGTLTGIPALIFGGLALREMDRVEWLRGRNLAFSGIALGVFDILLWSALFVIWSAPGLRFNINPAPRQGAPAALRVELLSVLSAPREINKLALSPDGEFAASVGEENVVRLWRVSGDSRSRELAGHLQFSRAVAISPAGQTVASGSDDGAIRLWQVSDGRLLHTLPGHEQYVFNLSFSPDGQTLVSAGNDKTVRWWRVSDGVLLKTVKSPRPEDSIITISPAQQLVGLYGPDKKFRLWSLSDNTLRQELPDHHYDVSGGGVFSPDSQLLALGSAEGVVRLWQASDGKLSSVLTGPGAAIKCVAFSPDGRMLAAGWSDGSIWLWRMSDGRLLQKLKGHRRLVSSLAFSADGQRLASGSEDQTIRLWQIITEAVIGR